MQSAERSILKKILFWNIVPLPRIFSFYLFGHLLFMLCFELYVAVQISLFDYAEASEPDLIFAAFMIPSFMLMYLTPAIWFVFFIFACINKPSIHSIFTVIILGLLVSMQQCSVVIAYH